MSGWGQLLVVMILLPILLVAVALYFLPSTLARRRRHPRYESILVLNFLLGWILVGWVVALVWALRPRSIDTTPPPTPAERGGWRAVPGNASSVGTVSTPPDAPVERFPDEPPRRRLQTNLLPLWPWSCAVVGAFAVLAGVILLAVSLAHAAARSNPVPIVAPLIVLAFGVLCLAIGWRWRRWQRAERRRLDEGSLWRDRKSHNPVRRDPDGTLTICERDPRGADIMMAICISGLVALVGFPALASRGASDAVLATAAALCAGAGLWVLVRTVRIALVADHSGVVVRNALRTYRFAWSDVAGFADGRSNGGEAGTMWALVIIGKDGMIVTSRATGRLRSARPVTARAIVALAARHSIPESMTGLPTRRPRRARDTGRGAPQSGRRVTEPLTGVWPEAPRTLRPGGRGRL
jgi:Superinfection immunity protein/Bacterial PH domain